MCVCVCVCVCVRVCECVCAYVSACEMKNKEREQTSRRDSNLKSSGKVALRYLDRLVTSDQFYQHFTCSFLPTQIRPESAKRLDFFALLGSASVKASHKSTLTQIYCTFII